MNSQTAQFKIDLHVHSRYSGDNWSDPEECICEAISAGLQGIAFTEHESYGVSEPIESLREKYGDRILVIRGVEFSSAEGHCLIFGVDPDNLFRRYTPLEEIVGIVSERDGVVIPSHPYRGGLLSGDRIVATRGITAIEAYNGANNLSANRKALDMAKNLGLPYTGGSDAHSPDEVGICCTVFSREITSTTFLPALKAGAYEGIERKRKTVSFGSFFGFPGFR